LAVQRLDPDVKAFGSLGRRVGKDADGDAVCLGSGWDGGGAAKEGEIGSVGGSPTDAVIDGNGWRAGVGVGVVEYQTGLFAFGGMVIG